MVKQLDDHHVCVLFHRLEYDRLKAELNSWKVEINNAVRTYQVFCDRNLELKKREDELQHRINELEVKKTESQETTTNSNQHIAKFQETNTVQRPSISRSLL